MVPALEFQKGHHQNIAYDTFKPKLKTTSKKVIFLTWDELNRLKDYQIPKDKQYLERVRMSFYSVASQVCDTRMFVI